jgi:uracil-DNA glycosylase family 4
MTRRWRVDAHAFRHERKSGVLQEPRGGALSQPSALRLRERLPYSFDCQRMFGKVNLVEEGRPFVGNTGKLLDELLEEAGIDRSKLYVTNIVKIRPTKEGGGSTQNRPPRAGEIRESIDVLKEELDLVKPRALALLGSMPAKAIIKKSFTLRSEHGTLFDTEFGKPALATYHPAYLLRLGG